MNLKRHVAFLFLLLCLPGNIGAMSGQKASARNVQPVACYGFGSLILAGMVGAIAIKSLDYCWGMVMGKHEVKLTEGIKSEVQELIRKEILEGEVPLLCSARDPKKNISIYQSVRGIAVMCNQNTSDLKQAILKIDELDKKINQQQSQIIDTESMKRLIREEMHNYKAISRIDGNKKTDLSVFESVKLVLDDNDNHREALQQIYVQGQSLLALFRKAPSL